MKPDNINNLSEKPRSCEDSTTENNSLSSDSDTEDTSWEANDQNRNIQGLRKVIKKYKTKINDLEMRLASEKKESHYKDELVKSLRMSIDLVVQNKDLNIKQMQKQIFELENALDLSKSQLSNKDKESSGSEKEKKHINFEGESHNNQNNIRDKVQIIKLERIVHKKNEQLEELNRKTQVCEANLSEKENHITQLESKIKNHEEKINELNEKLSEITLYNETCQIQSESRIFLSCTKIPSVKMVTLPDFEPFLADYEDIPCAGSGWMVIQRRIDGKLSFKQYENHYQNGFGDLGGELWLGLEKMHRLTANRRYELCIELVDFDDASAFARYDHFVVGSKEEKYALKSLGEYSGNAGDALRSHTNKAFLYSSEYYSWWYDTDCNLNGQYRKSQVMVGIASGIWWGRWNMGKHISLKSCKMLIRPKF
ncbi:fibrinogen-like protein 1 [Drosophila subpulchrella]|uniref:fibrinogen-like protein 1 n=1 Tax=Drosophila subpulchrella TaxID=1486046 RepID=UPI0018A1A142|nr:fibrinogen-like protein 1 [Drosophila subpulchrella]